jgi:ribonuclease Z
VSFPITWIALSPGESHQLGGQRLIECFSVTHVPEEPTVGYRVIESRRRLKAEFAQLTQRDIEKLSRQHGRGHVMEHVPHVTFAHSGDAMPVDATLVRNADLLVHDATFLEPGDRRAPIHASSREVFALAQSANVRALILNHLSIRYERSTALATLRAQRAESGFLGECWLLDEAAFINLQ